MRRVLQLLGTSALRSRLGIAVVLAIVIFGVVGVARMVSGPEDQSTGSYLPVETSAPATNANPAEADDGVAEPAAESPAGVDPGPSLSAGTAQPEAVAKEFATAWLDRTEPATSWYAALLPHATPDLAAKLKGVDPVVVPAERLTGPARVIPQGTGLVEVTYPVDSGTLLLRVVVADGRWLVDGVDWERG